MAGDYWKALPFHSEKARLGREVEECVHWHIFLTLNSQLFESIGEAEEGGTWPRGRHAFISARNVKNPELECEESLQGNVGATDQSRFCVKQGLGIGEETLLGKDNCGVMKMGITAEKQRNPCRSFLNLPAILAVFQISIKITLKGTPKDDCQF